MRKYWIGIFLLTGGLALLATCRARAGIVYSDEIVRKLLGDDPEKSHGVMIGQRERIRAIQEAFLSGDGKTIVKKADEIIEGIRSTSKEFALPGGAEVPAWKAMSNITYSAQQMKEAMKTNDYKTAYLHFSSAVLECIQCHQIVREWGKFSEPESARPKWVEAGPDKKKQ